jgi:HEAT repeat protein
MTVLEQFEASYFKGVYTTYRLLDDGRPLREVFTMLRAYREERRRPPEVPQEEEAREPPPPPAPFAEVFRQHRHLVLLGEPGAGKTTILRFTTVALAARAFPNDHEAERLRSLLPLDDAIPWFPIYLELAHYAGEGFSLADAVHQAVAQMLSSSRPLLHSDRAQETAIALLAQANKESRLCLLLDGLDEVAPEWRGEVTQAIMVWAKAQPQARSVITSRLAPFRAAPVSRPRTSLHILKPLTSEVAVKYFARWLAAGREEAGRSPIPPEEATEQADELVGARGRLRGHLPLRRVLGNPLFLRLAAEVVAEKGPEAVLRGGRANLYGEYVALLYGRAARQRCGCRPDNPAFTEVREAAEAALEAVAWRLQTKGALAWKEAASLPEVQDLVQGDFRVELPHWGLDFLRHTLGLLVQVGEEARFGHLTFQEYYAAWRLERWWQEDRAGVWAVVRPRLHAPSWQEPVDLLGSLLGPDEGEKLVRRVLRARSRYEGVLHRDLRRAARLSGETGVGEELRKRLAWRLVRTLRIAAEIGAYRDWRELLTVLGSPAVTPLIRALSDSRLEVPAGVLREIGVPALPHLIQVLEDHNDDVRRAAASVLGEIGDFQATPHLIRVLEDKDHNTRQAAVRALGKISDPRATPYLIQRLRDKNCHVREAVVRVLGEIDAPQVVPHLIQALEDRDSNVRGAAAWALGEIGGPQAVPYLIHALKDGEQLVREAAAAALGEIGDLQAIPYLIQALRDEERWVCQAAAEALGKIGPPSTLHLVRALGHKEWSVRQAAVEALGEIGDPQAAPYLIQALGDAEWSVRQAVEEALVKIGPSATSHLVQALGNEDSSVREAVARALRAIGDSLAAPHLTQALEDEEWFVCQAAAKALGEIGPPAIPHLVQVLEGKDSRARQAAVEALGEISDSQAVSYLVRALGDGDSYVQAAAAKALGGVGDPQAVPHLIQALEDENGWVRQEVARTLGAISDPRSTPHLVQALEDEEWLVRKEAVEALGAIGDPQIILHLIPMLEDGVCSVRQAVAEALGAIGDPQVILYLIKMLKDKDSNVRWRAAIALGRVGDLQATSHLVQALKDGEQLVRMAAVWALGELGTPPAVPYLIKALGDKEWRVRQMAAEALEKISDPQATPHLVQVLGDENSSVRQATAEALGEIGDPQAVSHLIQALRDAEWSVRQAAEEALAKIGPSAIPHFVRALKDRDRNTRWVVGSVLEKTFSRVKLEEATCFPLARIARRLAAGLWGRAAIARWEGWALHWPPFLRPLSGMIARGLEKSLELLERLHLYRSIPYAGSLLQIVLTFLDETAARRAPDSPPAWPRRLRACARQALRETLKAFAADLLKGLALSGLLSALLTWTKIREALGWGPKDTAALVGLFVGVLVLSLVVQWVVRGIQCLVK